MKDPTDRQAYPGVARWFMLHPEQRQVPETIRLLLGDKPVQRLVNLWVIGWKPEVFLFGVRERLLHCALLTIRLQMYEMGGNRTISYRLKSAV